MKFSEIIDGLMEGKAYQNEWRGKYTFIAIEFDGEGKPRKTGKIQEYTVAPAFAKYKTTFMSCVRGCNLLGYDDFTSEWQEVDLNDLIEKAKMQYWPEKD